MQARSWVRQIHRWVSVAFTLTVLVIFVTQAVGETPEWLFYLPLAPLLFLFLTGTYLFFLPYFGSRKQKVASDG
jgi:hypothetical protein